MKRKNVIIGIIIAILIIVIGVVLALLLIKNKGESGDKKDVKTYEMYVKINPLVKFTFSIDAERCEDAEKDIYACANYGYLIEDYELINNDAKEIYNDLNFYDMTLSEALVLLCDTAKDNKIVFDSVGITTDYDEYNYSTLNEYIKTESKYKSEYSIVVDIKEKINKEELLTEDEKNEPKEYSVIFNSDGGSKVKSQLLKEGEKVKKPENPTKQGYDFVEWVLDNKTYDFDKEVTQDLKLKAKWKRNQEETTTTTKKTTSTTTTTSKKGTSTTKSTTTTTADPHAGYLNLNDNITYYEWFTCGPYSYIIDTCKNKTFGELKALYPNNNITEDNSEWRTDDENLFKEGSYTSLVMYFPACSPSIPSNIKSSISNQPGVIFDVRDNTVRLSGLGFDKSSYNKYIMSSNEIENYLTKKSIYNTIACGGGGEPGEVQHPILNETTCSKYKLKCDRW